MKKVLSLLLLLFAFTACDNQVGKEFKSLANMSWQPNQIQEFVVTIPEAGTYAIFAELRHTIALSYPQAQINVEIEAPDGDTWGNDYTFVFVEDDEMVGSGMGDLVDTRQLLDNTVELETAGTYKFRLSHMQEKALEEIIEVGIIVEKAEDKND